MSSTPALPLTQPSAPSLATAPVAPSAEASPVESIAAVAAVEPTGAALLEATLLAELADADVEAAGEHVDVAGQMTPVGVAEERSAEETQILPAIVPSRLLLAELEADVTPDGTLRMSRVDLYVNPNDTLVLGRIDLARGLPAAPSSAAVSSRAPVVSSLRAPTPTPTPSRAMSRAIPSSVAPFALDVATRPDPIDVFPSLARAREQESTRRVAPGKATTFGGIVFMMAFFGMAAFAAGFAISSAEEAKNPSAVAAAPQGRKLVSLAPSVAVVEGPPAASAIDGAAVDSHAASTPPAPPAEQRVARAAPRSAPSVDLATPPTIALSATTSLPPPAPAPPATTGILRVHPELLSIVVDGEYRRVHDGAVVVTCGTHKVRVAMNAAQIVDVPCGSGVNIQ